MSQELCRLEDAQHACHASIAWVWVVTRTQEGRDRVKRGLGIIINCHTWFCVALVVERGTRIELREWIHVGIHVSITWGTCMFNQLRYCMRVTCFIMGVYECRTCISLYISRLVWDSTYRIYIPIPSILRLYIHWILSFKKTEQSDDNEG